MSIRNRNIAAILLSVLALSACGGTGSQSQPSAGGPGISVVDPSSKDSGAVASPVTQSIIRNGDLALETNNVEQVFKDVKDAVTGYDGRVESSNFQGSSGGYGPTAYVTVRVPEAKLDAFVEEVSKFGKRTSLSINTSDVTLQNVDLQAKVDALNESKTRLQKLLDKATTTADLISGEQALTALQTELDSYQSQLDYLKGQVAESTLNIQIVDNGSSVTSGLRSFKEIFLQAVRGFLNAFQSAFVFVITAIPWVLILGLGFLLVRFISRSFGRLLKRRNKGVEK
jgi:hypothetical protein